jgi:exopolysaccharide biosynthesis polyprenyl glycosylphosphotransferase
MNSTTISDLSVADRSAQPFLFAHFGGSVGTAQALGGAYFKRSKEQVRVRLYATLFALDLLCIAFAFLAVGALRTGQPLGEQALHSLAIVVPTFIAVAIHSGAYSLAALERPVHGATKSVIALFYAIAATIGLLFSLKVSTDFSRLVFAAGTLLSVVMLIATRIVVGNRIGRKHGWVFANHLVLVDSVPWDEVPGQPTLYTGPLGLDVAPQDTLLLHQLNHLLENCDRVVVACPPQRRRAWTEALRSTAIDVEITMPELNRLGATALGTQDGHATLLVSSGPLRLRHRMVKRALDLAVSIVGLIALAPLMILLAIAIKLDSRGPVLFRQLRFGRNNQMFSLLKFRSMRTECTDQVGNRSTRPGDDRLTRLGKFIRSTSLDELPQLFNVLGGTMSIVGPRPHAVGSTAEDSLFWQIDHRYFDRHAIKPGITGLAQIRGFRGATVHREDLTKRLQSDLEYVTGWTVWRDLKIIFATFAVLVHVNAY